MRSIAFRASLVFLTLLVTLALPAPTSRADDARPAKDKLLYYLKSSDIEFVAMWGGSGSDPGRFDSPTGIAVGPDGTLYVVDTGNSRIQVFDAEGLLLGCWGEPGSALGRLSNPRGIALGPDGSIFVADTFNHRVQKFSATGEALIAWGEWGFEDGSLSFPLAVAVGPDGSVYVADSGHDLVKRFAPDGKFIEKWDGSDEAGEFKLLVGIGAAADGTVFVADKSTNLLHCFDAEGNFLRAWDIYAPGGLTVTPAGSVFVVATWNHQVVRYTSTGDFLKLMGGEGGQPGSFHELWGMAVSPFGELYVSDTGNNRVQKFRFRDSDQPCQVNDEKLTLRGSIEGAPAQLLASMRVRIDAQDRRGFKFFGEVGPAEDGSYRFTRFPVDACYQVILIGPEDESYTQEPARYTGISSAGDEVPPFVVHADDAAPVLLSVQPNFIIAQERQPVELSVTLRGDGFSDGMRLECSGDALGFIEVTVLDPTEATALARAKRRAEAGWFDLTIENPDGMGFTLENAFEVRRQEFPQPLLESLEPDFIYADAEGPVSQVVAFCGQNFRTGLRVTSGSPDLSFLVDVSNIAATGFRAEVAAAAAAAPGRFSVTVENTDGKSSTLRNAFQIRLRDEASIPDDVYDLDTLTRFVRVRFAAEASAFIEPEEFTNLLRRVRDALAETYANIERVNDQGERHGYTASWERHADAVYLVAQDQVVDFAVSSSEGGILINKLQWIPVEPPW